MSAAVWGPLLAVLAGLAVLWAVLVAALFVAGRRSGSPMTLREAMRLLPDVVRLLRRLSTDPSLPRSLRWWLLLLIGYLALPIDLVPDFIPVLGYADDAIIVTVVLRSVVRRAGLAAVRRHWPGTDDGFAALNRLTGLGPQTTTT